MRANPSLFPSLRRVLLLTVLVSVSGCGLTKVVTVPLEFVGAVGSTALHVVDTAVNVVDTAAGVVSTAISVVSTGVPLRGVLVGE